MNRENVYERLTAIFRDVFDDESIVLSDNTTADDIEDWDSLEQINLVVAIEREFVIQFDHDEVGLMKNVGDMVNAILMRVEQK